MTPGIPLIERAYQLARSGTFANVEQLVKALSREGYESVEDYMQGGTGFRRQLTTIIRSAWIEAGNDPRARAPSPKGLVS